MAGQASSAPRPGLFRDYIGTIFVACVVAFFIRFFVIEAFRIPSSSMKPALEAGDTIFVAKWPFGLIFPGGDTVLIAGRAPRRGEAVVFVAPGDTSINSIKRVIGLPGDLVEVRKGRVLLNGLTISDPANSQATCAKEITPSSSYPVCWEPPMIADYPPTRVPPRTVFVLGDLRSEATEQAHREPIRMVPFASIRGKALWVWLSIEPNGPGPHTGWFSRIRFDRMFKTIE